MDKNLLILGNGTTCAGAYSVAHIFEQVGLHVYREGVLKAGLRKRYTNKTLYSIGLMFEPTSGEPLEVTVESTWAFAEGMVFHTYVLARGFGISETIAVTQTGYERLTNFPRQLFVAG